MTLQATLARACLAQGNREDRTRKIEKAWKREGRDTNVLFISQRCLELTLEQFPFLLTQ